jgi:hypothetical protein
MSNHPHVRPNGRPPQQIPIDVQPSPVPMQFVAEQIPGPQGNLVGLRIFTPQGMTMLFLSVDDAKSLANLLLAKATLVALT